MSDTPLLPDPNTAIAQMDKLATHFFFQRLSQHGESPINEQQAAQYLKLAATLESAESDPRISKMAQANDPIAEANTALDRFLVRSGVKTGADQENEIALQRQAAEIAQTPEFYNSVLSIKSAEAQAIVAQLNSGQNGNGHKTN